MAINYLQSMAGRMGRGIGVDPRRRIAQQLMAQGMDTSPAHLGTGIGRLGKALAAAYMMRQSQDQEADTMEWLTAKDPGRTRPPTEAEAYAASPDLQKLHFASTRPSDSLAELYPKGLEHLRDQPIEEPSAPQPQEEDPFAIKVPTQEQIDADTEAELARIRSDTTSPFYEEGQPTLSPSPTPATGGPRDHAQELKRGMTSYQSDPANQISDPRTRMEWLRESYRNNPELQKNWFANRLIQNMMLAEISRDEGLGKEKSGRPAAGIQYFDRRQELVNKGATPEELAVFDSMVRKDLVINRGDQFEIRSGVNPRGSTPMSIPKNIPLEKRPAHLGEVEQVKAERKFEGEKIAEARWDVPKAKREVESMVSLLDQIYKRGPDGNISFTHPGFEGTVGATWKPGMRFIHGTQEFAMDKLIKQVKDKNFLQAFQALKGGGHITEIEGDKATDSIAAIHIGMPEKDFIVELEKVRSVLMKGLALAKDKMSGTMQQPGQPKGDRRGRSGSGRVAPGWDPEDWKFLTDAEKKEAWGER